LEHILEYQLIIKIPFNAIDDIEARQKAHKFQEDVYSIEHSEDISVKLQETFQDKSPRGIPL